MPLRNVPSNVSGEEDVSEWHLAVISNQAYKAQGFFIHGLLSATHTLSLRNLIPKSQCVGGGKEVIYKKSPGIPCP